jgi:hypothetical protein
MRATDAINLLYISREALICATIGMVRYTVVA